MRGKLTIVYEDIIILAKQTEGKQSNEKNKKVILCLQRLETPEELGLEHIWVRFQTLNQSKQLFSVFRYRATYRIDI
jgi:hypothetical protein